MQERRRPSGNQEHTQPIGESGRAAHQANGDKSNSVVSGVVQPAAARQQQQQQQQRQATSNNSSSQFVRRQSIRRKKPSGSSSSASSSSASSSNSSPVVSRQVYSNERQVISDAGEPKSPASVANEIKSAHNKSAHCNRQVGGDENEQLPRSRANKCAERERDLTTTAAAAPRNEQRQGRAANKLPTLAEPETHQANQKLAQQQHQKHEHHEEARQEVQHTTRTTSAGRSLSFLLLGLFDSNKSNQQQHQAANNCNNTNGKSVGGEQLSRVDGKQKQRKDANTSGASRFKNLLLIGSNQFRLQKSAKTTMQQESDLMMAAASATVANKHHHHPTSQQQNHLSATPNQTNKPAAAAPAPVRTSTAALRQISAAIMLLSAVLLALADPSTGQVVNPNKLLSTRNKLANNRNLEASTQLATGGGGGSSSTALGPAAQIPGAKEGKLLVCYYTNWSQYRPKEGKYVPEDIDPHLCTHVIVAFGWMKKNRLSTFDASDDSKDGKKGLYERVTSLKLANPQLKVLIAVGGWSFGTEKFKTMAANRYNRQLFIFSALEFLRERNFDGLDIDWEFPQASDKKNFVDLLKELREAFDAEAKEKRLPKLLLTCAVSAGAETVRAGYDVAAIGAHVDFINIMSYDFHGKWESKTGHNAPLFASAGETEWRKQLSMDFGVKLWERMGAPKSKLVVGLATYGRSFTLASTSQHGMNAATSGGGKAGEFTREAGFLAFYEICDMLKQGASYYWDEEQAVPYAVQADQWVGFDDELSIRNKVKWLNEQGYAGAMVWALDMDDFKGTCTPKKYPLMRAMAEGLFNLPVRPSQEWRLIIEAARARANAPKTPAGGQTASEVAAAAAAAVVTAVTAAAGPAAGAQSPVIDLSALKNIPGLNLTSILSSPSALAALTVANPQLASQLIAQQNRSLESTNARVVCYYTNWSYKRPGAGHFGPDNLDPHLCTHIIYAFYGLKDSKLVPTEEIDSSDNEQAPYKRIIALKQMNPNLKVMLAVGGWMMGYAPFRQLTENAYRQTFFTFEVIEFLRKKNFDGLDLCWEFPRGLDDKEKFSNLVKELRESFDGEAKSSGKPRLLLSAAVPASFEAITAGYDVPVINKHLDFMNVMTYDFHGDWEQVVGHNSPLYPLNSATPYQKKLTLDFSAAEWVRQGASKENLVIGLPTYGRTFTLANPNLTDIDAPAARGGKPGQYTKESGFLSFFEVCEMLKNQATLVWDNEQMIPYAYKGDQWVGFDDPRSFKMKVQWLKQNGYSGIMIWSVDMDDFAGTCMGLRYPLIKSAKEELKGYYVPNLVESAQGSSIHPSIGSKDKDELQCEETDGHITYHKDKKDCTMYYMCEGSRKHHMPCPQNLVFNQNDNVCDWPENVEGCGTKAPTATTATT